MRNPSRGGASGSLGGDIPNPTPKPAEPQPLDAIDVFLPGAPPEQKPVRRGIHETWEIATARGTLSKCGRERQIAWAAADAARDWAFRPGSLADLKDIRRALLYLALAAGIFARIEGPDHA